ncbi:dTMP kinase [Streptomyces qinglanensis]|uniref:dTMP kinase n=1 Tax=Streptomyces qinglanensis TaxID=943816 RepID=UPI003D75161E
MKGYVILGYPGEQREDLDATVRHIHNLWDLADRNPSTFRASVFEFRPYPGTPVWQKLLSAGHDAEQMLAYADVDLADDGADESMRARDEFNFSVGIRFGEVPLPKLRATLAALTREQHDRTRRPGGGCMTAGRFITLDGPGGVGKSTTVAALAALLRDRGEHVHATTEPSSSPLGQFTRSHADQISGHALACLVAADRYDHIRTGIQPRLDAGDTVVCDRYLASTLVVQRLDGVPERFLLDLNADIVLPDVAVLLTADPGTIADRLTGRGTHHRFERDPSIPAREVELYRHAADVLERMGVPVVSVNTSAATPTEAAARILASLGPVLASVGDDTNPDKHTVTS